MNIRRYANGEVIGVTEIHPFMEEACGFPWIPVGSKTPISKCKS